MGRHTCVQQILPAKLSRSQYGACNEYATSQSMHKTSVILRRLNKYLSIRKSAFASDEAGVFLPLESQ